MEWMYLVAAGFLETTWAVTLKYTDGFTCLWLSLLTGAAMLGSVYLLDLSLKTIPIGTAYAVCTGIGAAGTAAIGMLWLGEPHQVMRIVCIVLIVAGAIGLKMNI